MCEHCMSSCLANGLLNETGDVLQVKAMRIGCTLHQVQRLGCSSRVVGKEWKEKGT